MQKELNVECTVSKVEVKWSAQIALFIFIVILHMIMILCYPLLLFLSSSPLLLFSSIFNIPNHGYVKPNKWQGKRSYRPL